MTLTQGHKIKEHATFTHLVHGCSTHWSKKKFSKDHTPEVDAPKTSSPPVVMSSCMDVGSILAQRSHIHVQTAVKNFYWPRAGTLDSNGLACGQQRLIRRRRWDTKSRFSCHHGLVLNVPKWQHLLCLSCCFAAFNPTAASLQSNLGIQSLPWGCLRILWLFQTFAGFQQFSHQPSGEHKSQNSLIWLNPIIWAQFFDLIALLWRV